MLHSLKLLIVMVPGLLVMVTGCGTSQISSSPTPQLTAVQIGLLSPDQATILAEAGDAVAQCLLGDRYFTGGDEGFPKDARKALSWYCRAAAQGEPYAWLNLGFLAISGTFVATKVETFR